MNDIKKDLKTSPSDVAHTLLKAGLQTIPCGGAISEVLNMILVPPLERRREKWLLRIFDSLTELENKIDGFSLENLKDNDLFITIIIQATQIALRNHQEEKLQSLHYAVINSAKNVDISDTKQLLFLNIISELTPWHIKLLDFYNRSDKYITKDKVFSTTVKEEKILNLIYLSFPDLRSDDGLIFTLVKDLYNNTLISIYDLNHKIKEINFPQAFTTQFGKDFIKFISSNDETLI